MREPFNQNAPKKRTNAEVESRGPATSWSQSQSHESEPRVRTTSQSHESEPRVRTTSLASVSGGFSDWRGVFFQPELFDFNLFDGYPEQPRRWGIGGLFLLAYLQEALSVAEVSRVIAADNLQSGGGRLRRCVENACLSRIQRLGSGWGGAKPFIERPVARRSSNQSWAISLGAGGCCGQSLELEAVQGVADLA
jgi:hypothetical protein